MKNDNTNINENNEKKMENPNLFYVRVLENGKFVIRQARFTKLLCRIDSLYFSSEEKDVLYCANGEIKAILQLAGVDTPIVDDIRYGGSYLSGYKTLEEAKIDGGDSSFYTIGNSMFINLSDFGITYDKVENALKKYYNVKKETFSDGDGGVEDEYEINVFGYSWNGLYPTEHDLSSQVYYDILNNESYSFGEVYYPSAEACEKNNKVICYRFED